MFSKERNEMQTAIFDKYGCFFAFSEQQFADKRVDGVEYTSLGVGLICPAEKAREFLDEFKKANKEFDEKVVAEKGKVEIISYELGNHEYNFTHDISNTVAAVEHYGITESEVAKVAPFYLRRHYAWEAHKEDESDKELELAYLEACAALDGLEL